MFLFQHFICVSHKHNTKSSDSCHVHVSKDSNASEMAALEENTQEYLN